MPQGRRRGSSQIQKPKEGVHLQHIMPKTSRHPYTNNVKTTNRKPVYPIWVNGLDPRPKAKGQASSATRLSFADSVVSVRTRGFVPPGLPGFTLDGRNLQSLVVSGVLVPRNEGALV